MDVEMAGTTTARRLAEYPLLAALLGRRSRRFGLGMKIDSGPLTYTSRYPPSRWTRARRRRWPSRRVACWATRRPTSTPSSTTPSTAPRP